ncbi:MAG: YdcF family protein [Oscillospiraceae bacterium]|nr:YdcF family protein [Oscillospiraceae bacterium]
MLGCHDFRVPDHAAALFHFGVAPLVLCTGGYGKMTEDSFSEPEGVLFARRCMELEVPAKSILVEDKATNTGDNFTLSRALLSGKQRGIVVCKPYMAKRALATGRKQWPEISWSISIPDIPFEQYMPDESALLPEIELMVGDLQRLKVYAERGYQAPTDVPEEIWAAWRRLIAAGFGKYVL